MRRPAGGALLLLWLLALCSAAPGRAESTLESIEARLSQAAVVRADFHQEKSLRALSRPLISEGRLLYAAGRGVLWQVTEPYETALLVTGERIVEWDGAGEKQPAAAGDNPFFRAWADVILALLSGDVEALRQHFELAPESLETGWRLALKPKSELLGKAIAGIRVEGDRFVERIEIDEARGDRTTIRFERISDRPAELDAKERDYFAP